MSEWHIRLFVVGFLDRAGGALIVAKVLMSRVDKFFGHSFSTAAAGSVAALR